jgi:hypothetical protein
MGLADELDGDCRPPKSSQALSNLLGQDREQADIDYDSDRHGANQADEQETVSY